MATGRQMKLVGQTGEYLVAAELGRRGLIATTFTGNVPDYDILKRALPITINGSKPWKQQTLIWPNVLRLWRANYYPANT
jgi:hypothetical protein